MKKLIIFGSGKIADSVYNIACDIPDIQVVAFTCDKEYIKSEEFNGLPVIPFDDMEKKYLHDEYYIFVAVGYQELNTLREKKLQEAKSKGYKIISLIHPKVILPHGFKYGENCFIMYNVCVQPGVELGNNVFVWGGALIGHHSKIGDNCWITGGANIAGSVKIGKNCFFAINSTVVNEVIIGNKCIIGAGALVTKNLEDEKVIIDEATPVFRLNSSRFLRITRMK